MTWILTHQKLFFIEGNKGSKNEIQGGKREGKTKEKERGPKAVS